MEKDKKEIKLNGEIVYIITTPPKEFLDKFKHKNINFITDEFEELIIQDISRYDQDTLIKINRNVTEMFRNWINNKITKKENVSLNAKGTTRSGKSLGMLAISDQIIDNYPGKEFNPDYIISANQKEYRLKLKDADFGDVQQIDENAFANVGLGSVTEMQQLKDIQNIIAKKNIHTIYITPRVFLETNASMGLSTWGKDPINWLSRFLLYDLRHKTIPLLGYVVIDVGKLFRKYGCYVYKETGGCTNPNKKSFEDLDKENIEYSDCIPKDYKKEDLVSDCTSCPFYKICKHPLAKYEHKKDTWIAREMKGGLDERTSERYESALGLFEYLGEINPEGNLTLKARDGKQLKVKVNLYIPKITATKFTQTEIEEILVLLKGFVSLDFIVEVCNNLNIDVLEYLKKINGYENLSRIFKDEEEMQNILKLKKPKNEE